MKTVNGTFKARGLKMKSIIALTFALITAASFANTEPCQTEDISDPIRCGYLWSD